MDVIVDANVLFSALIADGLTAELLLSSKIRLFAPEYLLDEFRKYKKYLKDKTKRTHADFEGFFELLERRITLIPREEFRTRLQRAKSVSPDPKDVPYVALALQLQMPIWSNDRPLKSKQAEAVVHNTQDIMRILRV